MRLDGGREAGSEVFVGTGAARRRFPVRVGLIGVGLLAGTLAWLVGEATVTLVRPVVQMANVKGTMLPATDRWGETVAAMCNAGVAFAALGGLLGAGLGVVGGLATGAGRRAAWAALIGLALGVVVESALTAGLLGPYGLWRFHHPDEASRDLVLPLLVFPGIWLGAGAAAGAAFAWGARDPIGRAAVNGAVGAAVAGAAFLLLEAFFFPSGDSVRFVSATGPVRLGARLAVVLGTAIALVTEVGRASGPKVAPADTPTDPALPPSDQGAGSTMV